MNMAWLVVKANRNTDMQYQTSTSEMVKELKEVKDVFNGSPIRHERVENSERVQQIMLDITLQLQTSLELEWVVSQFMDMIHAYLQFDGFMYRLEQPTTTVRRGRQKGHQCEYRLSIDQVEMGKLQVFRGRKFVESELMLLENLLCSLLYPLRNSIQYRSATLSALRDPLTGVNNRSSFDEALVREMNLARRSKQNFSVLVIDIDHFKKVNDNYGHSVGDEVLKHVADQIRNSIRNTDQLFRFGGEEFVVLLNNADCDVAGDIADRILETVSETVIQVNDKSLSVSVSIGLSCLVKGDTVDALFNRADQALYAAKNDGRNQVKIA